MPFMKSESVNLGISSFFEAASNNEFAQKDKLKILILPINNKRGE